MTESPCASAAITSPKAFTPYAEYYALTGEKAYLDRAKQAYELYWGLFRGLIDDSVGMGPKTIPETRTGRSLGLAMIYLNIRSVLRRCDPENTTLYDERAEICVHDIFAYHHKPELGCTLENVGMNGEFRGDVTKGRVLNPGHDIECSWFLMEYANHKGDARLHQQAENVFNLAINAGWTR